MKTGWHEPNDYENAQASLVQIEIVEVFNRFAKEGIEPQLLAAGAGAAIADLLTAVYGNHLVPEWFQKQASFTRKLIADTHH